MSQRLLTKTVTAALLFTACCTMACGTPADEDNWLASEASELAIGAQKILPAAAQHIYFGTTSDASIDANNSLSQRYFTANPGAQFTTVVANRPGGEVPGTAAQVGFKLQRAVKQRGTYAWSVVGQADGRKGQAALSYTPPRSSGVGLYLITSTASPLPAQLNLDLRCLGTGCAPGLQPGEACGGFIGGRDCAQGSYCAYTIDQQCGSGDQQGVCTVSPSYCPRGIRYNPICGCDGKTYDGPCNATAGGTSMQRVGACEHNVTGDWSFASGDHYNYTFNPDGTFLSARLPSCLFATPTCAIRINSPRGIYNLYGQALSLFYSSDYRHGETAQFTIEGPEDDLHLRGTDYGVSLDLTRSR